MNTGVKVSDLQSWRSCLGLCMICGQPMGIQRPQSNYRGKTEREIEDAYNDDTLEIAGNDIESLLLTPECPIRQVMFAHSILGVKQKCHLVDQYTFLKKPKTSDSFKAVFEKYKENLVEIDQAFSTFLEDINMTSVPSTQATVYDDAEATCKRVADGTTVSGCVLCNKAMARDGMHINAVYRCFSLSKEKNIPKLESNTKQSIPVKKVLQQIALYFEPTNVLTKIVWKAKTGEKLLIDAALWRCIAHLCAWGQSNQFRFRLIAVFHAAHYLYQNSSLNGSLSLEDWHIHLFRDFYMTMFSDANTWFGMDQMEASIRFNLSQKWGDQWVEFVKTKLQMVGMHMENMYLKKNLTKIPQFKEMVVRYVSNEQSLLNFVCSKRDAEHGVNRLLYFFKYNISSPGEVVLLKNCKLFEDSMCKAYRKLQYEQREKQQLQLIRSRR